MSPDHFGQSHTPALFHRIGEQAIGFCAAFVGREIVSALEINRIDFFDRNKFLYLDIAVRLGFQSREFVVGDLDVAPLLELTAVHEMIAFYDFVTDSTEMAV